MKFERARILSTLTVGDVIIVDIVMSYEMYLEILSRKHEFLTVSRVIQEPSTYIVPDWIKDDFIKLVEMEPGITGEYSYDYNPEDIRELELSAASIWYNTIEAIEESMYKLLERRRTPKEAASLTPRSSAVKFTISGTSRGWKAVLLSLPIWENESNKKLLTGLKEELINKNLI